MADKRESILARLVELAEAVPNVATAARNVGSLDDDALPAILVFDADEASLDAENGRVQRSNASPVRVAMTPEIIIRMRGAPEEVGTDLNAMRLDMIEAVLTDTELAGLCENIRYVGCQTQLAYGREMSGDLALAFAFTYVLAPLQF